MERREGSRRRQSCREVELVRFKCIENTEGDEDISEVAFVGMGWGAAAEIEGTYQM